MNRRASCLPSNLRGIMSDELTIKNRAKQTRVDKEKKRDKYIDREIEMER